MGSTSACPCSLYLQPALLHACNAVTHCPLTCLQAWRCSPGLQPLRRQRATTQTSIWRATTQYTPSCPHMQWVGGNPLLCMPARQCLVLPSLQAGPPGRLHLLNGLVWALKVIKECSLCALQVVSQRTTSSWLPKSTSSISQIFMLPRRSVPFSIDCCSCGSLLLLCRATTPLAYLHHFVQSTLSRHFK